MSKVHRIVYWISTLWLSLGMVSTGMVQLLKVKAEGAIDPPGVDGIIHLGYPVYFLTILGVSKILGVVVLLIPKFALIKEWAYAGFFFMMTGAVFSHVASGDRAVDLLPSLLLLALIVISWYFRPSSRRLVALNVNQIAS